MNGTTYSTIDPATGECSARFDDLDAAGIETALASAARGFDSWRKLPVTQRAAALSRVADALLAEKQALAALATLEMGKPLAQAVAEVEKCADICRHYAGHGEAMLAQARVALPSGTAASVRLQPLGPVLAVMPWNFPYLQIVRFVAPTLAGGNVAVVKPAASVPQCALALQRILDDALPPGVCQTLLLRTGDIAGLIADPRIAAVTLTGSERAGQAVATAAGQVLKKCVLELGGSDAFVVMPSADLDQAVRMGVQARTANNGQSCVCAKRFIVHEAVYPPFEQAFVAALQALKAGHPAQADVQLGPLASERARHDLHAQVQAALSEGARLLCGGVLPDGPGYYYPPTALADIPPGAQTRQQEMFGPVAMLFRVGSLEEAIAVANETPFGLGSAIWTRDVAEQNAFIENVQAGITAVNALVFSDARLPFGGVKRSGYGRELSSAGLLEFLNMKTVIGA